MFIFRKISAFLLASVFLLVLIAPFLVLAQPTPVSEPVGGLVPCGVGKGPEDCGFDDLRQLVNNVLNFAMWVATVLAAVVIIWAGGRMIWNSSFEGNPSKAGGNKKMIYNVMFGYFIVAVAWLVVKEFIDFFVADSGLFRDAFNQVFVNGN